MFTQSTENNFICTYTIITRFFSLLFFFVIIYSFLPLLSYAETEQDKKVRDAVVRQLLQTKVNTPPPTEEKNEINNNQLEETRTDTSLDKEIPQISEITEESDKTEVKNNSEKNEITKDAEISETKEVAKDTEISETMEAAKDAEMPKTVEATKDAEIPKTVEATKDTEIPKTVEATKDTEIPKTVEATKDTEIPETTEATKDVEISKSTEVAKDAEIPETTIIAKDAETAEVASTPKKTTVKQTPTSSKIVETSKKKETIEKPIKKEKTLKTSTSTSKEAQQKTQSNKNKNKNQSTPLIELLSEKEMQALMKDVMHPSRITPSQSSTNKQQTKISEIKTTETTANKDEEKSNKTTKEVSKSKTEVKEKKSTSSKDEMIPVGRIQLGRNIPKTPINKLTEAGWIYLGRFEKKQWQDQTLETGSGLPKIGNSYPVKATMINVRDALPKKGKMGKTIRAVKHKEKVRIIKIRGLGRNRVHYWAKIQ